MKRITVVTYQIVWKISPFSNNANSENLSWIASQTCRIYHGQLCCFKFYEAHKMHQHTEESKSLWSLLQWQEQLKNSGHSIVRVGLFYLVHGKNGRRNTSTACTSGNWQAQLNGHQCSRESEKPDTTGWSEGKTAGSHGRQDTSNIDSKKYSSTRSRKWWQEVIRSLNKTRTTSY